MWAARMKQYGIVEVEQDVVNKPTYFVSLNVLVELTAVGLGCELWLVLRMSKKMAERIEDETDLKASAKETSREYLAEGIGFETAAKDMKLGNFAWNEMARV